MTSSTSAALSFNLIAKCATSEARASELTLPHSTVLTPVFMPVGTQVRDARAPRPPLPPARLLACTGCAAGRRCLPSIMRECVPGAASRARVQSADAGTTCGTACGTSPTHGLALARRAGRSHPTAGHDERADDGPAAVERVPHHAVQHLPPRPPTRARAPRAGGRPAQVHGLEGLPADGQRRLPDGVAPRPR